MAHASMGVGDHVSDDSELLQQMIEESSGSTMVVALRKMSDADRKAVLTALADPSIKTRAIERVLQRNKYDVSYDAIRRFRSKRVAIPPELEF